MTTLAPRLVIAGTHSGVGKTTVATGLMAAFGRAGARVGAAKVGPDFIDTGYHALATARPSRNLDAWMCGAEVVRQIAARASRSVDLLVIEGVMGLFDGSSDPETPGEGSTAHASKLLDAPVVLVVDASAMSTSVAAVVHGFATFDPALRLAGVILNRVGSDTHEQLLRDAVEPLGIPVLGALRRDERFNWRDRHLGLVPVAEDPLGVERSLRHLADTIGACCDLGALETIARSAPATVVDVSSSDRSTSDRRVRIAIASGRAFTFMYQDNIEALEGAGAELIPFDPLTAPALDPDLHGLIVGGGFPEIYGHALAANTPLLRDVRARIDDGLVTWAECAGLLWLARSLDGSAMCGVIDAEATMTNELTLGYRRASATTANPVLPVGHEVRGHEFHYSRLSSPGDSLVLRGRNGVHRAGYATPTLLASYLHLHLAGRPQVADHFVATCARSITDSRRRDHGSFDPLTLDCR